MNRDVICVGASAGGLEALREIIRGLAGNLPAAIVVVIHTTPHTPSWLPEILTRTDHIPAYHAKDGDSIENGRIFVAPPDTHLLIDDGKVRLSQGPRENFARPAIDPLFRSAAQWRGPGAIGIILSGNLDDGTAGLHRLKSSGGVAIVQAPSDAAFVGMPQSAIENVEVDYILPKEEIAPLLMKLAHEPIEAMEAPPTNEDFEIIARDIHNQAAGERQEAPSVFTCPECGGALWELRDGDLIRYRCHVGHAYSIGSLTAGISQQLEDGLWSAVRKLHDKALIHRRMAITRKHAEAREQQEILAQQAEAEADLILRLLADRGEGSTLSIPNA